jgi:phage-related protein
MKQLIWIGSSQKDLSKFPSEVKEGCDFGILKAQMGEMPGNAKVLKGFGDASIVEIIEKDSSGTYRAVYTVRFAKVVFVLHAFQKKSKSGIKTDKKDIDLIKDRLKRAEKIYKELYKR